MATNGKSGDNRRHGAVRNRSQVFNPATGRWVKRDASTGRFMDGKSDDKPFKGVRKHYAYFNGGPSHKAINKNTLKFIGVRSVKITAIGPVRLSKVEFREKWLKKVEKLGVENK